MKRVSVMVALLFLGACTTVPYEEQRAEAEAKAKAMGKTLAPELCYDQTRRERRVFCATDGTPIPVTNVVIGQ
jgi:hypothetical protein